MLEFLIEDSYVSADDRIAVGVSGGADSMLLLWALIDKQKKTGFYFEVINVNHHIRGKEADQDSLFVEEFCKKRKIPYEIVDVDAKRLKKDEKMTLEEAARVARYDAFNKIMTKNKLNKLFLAHHKNDQAETILMHIFRGSGVAGACGIKNSERIIRPLLNLKKSEILKMAEEYGIKFVEDSTNSENDCSRNYLRNVVIPEIEKIYPAAVSGICSFGQRCQEIQDYILSNIDDSKIIKNGKKITLKEEVFSQPNFIIREYINKAFKLVGVFSDMEAKHFDSVISLMSAQVNKFMNLPHLVIARRTYAGVEIFKESKNKSEQLEYSFCKNGVIEFGNYCKIYTKIVSRAEVEYKDGVIYIDAFKVSNNAVWRTRKLGDMFSKLGTGSKKLNDYFTDKKIDASERDFIPVLANGNQVLVVLGKDVSENVKIDGFTDEIVMITTEML